MWDNISYCWPASASPAGRGLAQAAGCSGADPQLSIRSLDAPLVAPGDTHHLLNFDGTHLANPATGFHFCLHNNLWGTAFPQWCEAVDQLELCDLFLLAPRQRLILRLILLLILLLLLRLLLMFRC